MIWDIGLIAAAACAAVVIACVAAFLALAALTGRGAEDEE